MKSFGLQWHITDKCDQRCKHCYIYSGEDKILQKELSMKNLKRILDNYLQMCNKMKRQPYIAITGGDPLLHSNVWDFFKLLKSNKVKFSILGNPFHINEEVLERLKEMGCSEYQMSLDGLRETHDIIRKRGSFDITLQKIKEINSVGLISTIMTTVSKTNINELAKLVPIVVDAGVKYFAFARYCPNEKDLDNLISPEEYRGFLERMWNVFIQYKDSNTVFNLKDHLWTLFLYEKGLFNINDEPAENVILDGCHCGISHFTVLSDGTLYACRRCESPVGNAIEESMYDVFFGEKMDIYREYDKFEACSKCELLRFCRGCPSVAKCVTGNFYSKDPQCWKKI